MKEFIAEEVRVETASALEAVLEAGKGERYGAYVGLDVHKETLAVAVALPGNKKRWTAAHYTWLEGLTFAHDWQQVVLQEYIDAVKAAGQRVADMRGQMRQVLPQWRLAPVVDALTALRGIDQLSAMTLLAELGDIVRQEMPRLKGATA
jgi:transposase